mmetsp:Transcript_7246/g.10783  ORF Transcript_7246/g.10783 Transcript_7246/m.10783 type:complete len:182 (+) Transcript_7246:144-689(+)
MSYLCCLYIFIILVVSHCSDFPTLSPIPTATLRIKTSWASYAGTQDTIYALFTGDFASSGPYSIGSFEDGSQEVVRIPLDKVIGKLTHILLYTNGTDGWLMSDFKCIIDSSLYEFSWQRQWLDTLDPTLLELYGNGHEPYAQESDSELPGQATQMLTVVNEMLLTDQSGRYRPNLSALRTG